MQLAHPHGIVRDHLAPALETALAGFFFGAGGIPSRTECRPSAERLAKCAVVAEAAVAEPGATTAVLDYVRRTARADTVALAKPILTEIRRERPDRFTVHYLRN